MSLNIESLIDAVRPSLSALVVATLAFGGWSATQPERSVALYQTIMRWCNWRVEPIDRRHELRTTRRLGLALVLLSLVTLALLWA